jgi:serine/threonine protein kinase
VVATPERASWDFVEGAAIAPGRTIVKRLGGGNRFEVYLVWDDRLFSLMVAKLIRPDQVDDPRALQELEREWEILGRLAHPVLLRGFGMVPDGPHPHLLLEHLEGPTLRRLIKLQQGPLPLEQLLPLALHVTAVLHYLSCERVVHLDIKPSNIVMGLPPRVIDLSVARSLDRAAKLAQPIGTDQYMAPEQCDPATYPGLIGPPADVWGLGATLHHATTGGPPFPRAPEDARSDDLSVRFPQLYRPPVPLPRSVPPPLAELIVRTLAKDPGERPVAEDVATALEPLVAAVPRRAGLLARGSRRA